ELDATKGTLTGLTNTDLNGDRFAKDGRAATEEQLQLIADAQQEIDDFAVKYDKNPDGTVNKDSVTFAGTEGTSATKDPLTGKTVMEGGTSLNNVGSAGDYTDLGNAYNAVNAGDLNNAVTDVTDKGLSFAGNAGDDVHRKLGETLGIKGGITDATRSTSGENVITRTDDKGNINIELATDATFDSITAADADGNSTVLDKEGVAVVDEEGNKAVYGATQTKLTSGDNVTTIDAGSVAVTNGTNTLELDATKGTLTGLTNTDLNGDRFAKDGRAATEEQLSAVSGSISTIIGGGVTNNNGEVTGPFTVNNNEYTTVASAIEKETKAAKTEVRKGTNIASVYESTGSNGQSIYTINADGTSVSAGSEAVTVTRGVKDSNNVTDYAVDLSDATKESLVKADSALQTVVTQIDGVDVKTIHKDDNTANFMSGENIVLTPETDGSIKVATAADVKFKSITTVEINASNVTTDSLTINNGPVINESGIDMRNKRVTNVAAGVEAADAVNLSQLEGVRNDLHTEIGGVRRDLHQVDRSLRAGVAAAMATAALPQAYLPGKSMLAMGGGTWKGESGVALGVSKITDNGKWVFKFSGNASTRGDYGGTVGAGYQW
ncbi:MAG: YadA-like family protein, partial [Atribacterota bacterium]|nr:YadA-like family protein [Atribacterota bacterium]